MARVTFNLFFSLLLAGSLFAEEKAKEDIPWLLDQLAEGAAPRKAAEEKLMTLSLTKLKEIVVAAKAAKKGDDPELRSRAGGLLEKLYRRHKLGEGTPYHGMTLGWFMEHTGKEEGKSVCSCVLVLAVEKGSPAEKAKIQVGDAIFRIEKTYLRDFNAKNYFVERISKLKSGTEIKLYLKYSGSTRPLASYHKHQQRVTMMTLGEPKKTSQGSKIDPKSMEAWVAQIM